MKTALKKVTYSDGSKARLFIIDNGDHIGNMKITVKQWLFLQKMGIKEQQVERSIDKPDR